MRLPPLLIISAIYSDLFLDSKPAGYQVRNNEDNATGNYSNSCKYVPRIIVYEILTPDKERNSTLI